MEMTRTEENEALIAPSPFDSSTEREFLTTSQVNVPTAIPVDDAFQENIAPATAVVVAAPVTNAVMGSSDATAAKEEEKIRNHLTMTLLSSPNPMVPPTHLTSQLHMQFHPLAR